MCLCTPAKRALFCGLPGCQAPRGQAGATPKPAVPRPGTPEHMAPLVGLSVDVYRDVIAQVQANQARLGGCKRHDFSEPVPPRRTLGQHWKCTACGGEVDSIAMGWYTLGLQHAQQPAPPAPAD